MNIFQYLALLFLICCLSCNMQRHQVLIRKLGLIFRTKTTIEWCKWLNVLYNDIFIGYFSRVQCFMSSRLLLKNFVFHEFVNFLFPSTIPDSLTIKYRHNRKQMNSSWKEDNPIFLPHPLPPFNFFVSSCKFYKKWWKSMLRQDTK